MPRAFGSTGGPVAGQLQPGTKMFLMLLLFHCLWAKEISNQNYVIRKIESCPVVGYYFKRELPPNSVEAECYLCFCQNEDTAICWIRENRKCDVQSYHHNVEKRQIRNKRSPFSLGELFFKDAAKDVFDKNNPENCKPYESSFSEGCPPDDWCMGCTVCDCTANGHWNCHILSFCDDKPGKPHHFPGPKGSKKKPQQKNANNQKPKTSNTVAKRNITPSKTMRKGMPKKVPRGATINKNKFVKKIVNKLNKNVPIQVAKHKSNIKRASVSSNTSKNTKNQVIKSKKSTTTKNNKNKDLKKGKVFTKPAFVKKGAKKPVSIKTKNNNNISNVITDEAAKQVMTAITSIINAGVTASLPDLVKMIQKRSMEVNKDRTLTVSRWKGKQNDGMKILSGLEPDSDVDFEKYRRFEQKLLAKNKMISAKHTKSVGKAKNKLGRHYRNKRLAVHDVTSTEILALDVTNTTPFNSTVTDIYKDTTKVYNSTVYTVSPILSNETDLSVYYKYLMDNPNITTMEPFIETVSSVITTEMQSNNTLSNITDTIELTTNTIILNISINGNDTSSEKSKNDLIPEFHRLPAPFYRIVNNTNFGVKSNVKFHGKNINRKISKLYKRFNITRIINNIPLKKNKEFMNVTDVSKLQNIQNLLKIIFGDKTNTTNKTKKKTFNTIKYLKKIFNKLFYQSRIKGTSVWENNHTIQTVCETFGPCVLNQRNYLTLQHKIKALNNETAKITKSIQIIKGLLRLIDLPTDYRSSDLNGTDLLRNDMNKLNDILKLSINDEKTKLTETQIVQTKYIKSNTREFIQSIVKFVHILNDVIELLTKNKERSNYRHEFKHNVTKHDPIDKLKKLLVQYNVIQNTFIKKIYETFIKSRNESTKENEVSGERNVGGNSAAIERFSNNVISNLQKLKNLADTLNVRGRSKREVLAGDDAMEYLLLMMEYIMKKKYPHEKEPVKDGIDMLIEAIKNAPDIKSTQMKKIRQHKNNKSYKNIKNKTDNKMDNLYYKRSKDGDAEKQSTNTKQLNQQLDQALFKKLDNSINTEVDQNLDEEKSPKKGDESDERDTKSIEKNRPVKEKEVSHFDYMDVDNKKENELDLKRYTNDDVIYGDQTYTENNNKSQQAYTVYIETSNKNDQPYNVGNIEGNNNKSVRVGGGDDVENKKFDKVISDFEDYSDSDEAYSTTSTPHTTSERITEDLTENEIKNIPDVVNNNMTRPRLQWVDTFVEEDKPRLIKVTTESVTEGKTNPITEKVVHSKPPKKRIFADISDVSKEVGDSEINHKITMLGVEELRRKKQMDLLNSLDYGTEGTLTADDSDLKYERFADPYF